MSAFHRPPRWWSVLSGQRSAVLVAALVLVAVRSLAATPALQDPLEEPLRVPDDAAPAFSVFTTRDGLSDEIWSAVTVAPDGFVWAGSASSLARFDGYGWTLWPFPEARSLVRDLQADVDGTVWAVFEREGLASYDGQRWSLAGGERVIQRFSTIERDGRSELWLAHNHDLARRTNGRWQTDPGPWPASAPEPAVVERTDTLFGTPREWMGSTNDGLWYRSLAPAPGPWTRFEHPAITGIVADLLRSEDAGVEELWVLTAAGLACIRGDDVRAWSADRGEIPTNAAYRIVQTGDAAGVRSLWVATRAGLLRLRQGRLDLFDRRHGLPSDAVRDVTVQRGADGTQVLWLATEGGIARATLTETPWRTVSLLGARDAGVFGLLLEPDGRGGERLWIGSQRDGLGLLEQGRWRHLTRAADGTPTPGIRGIWRLPTAAGGFCRIAAPFAGGLVEITDDLRLVPVPTPWPAHPDNQATDALARHADGTVEWWVATGRDGVHRWRDGRWTTYTRTNGPPGPWAVFALAEQRDRAGRSWLWAAGGGGLARFDGRQWAWLPAAAGVPDDLFQAVRLVTRQGRQELWVGGRRSGVIRLDVTDPAQPRPLRGDDVPAPPDPTVYSILADSRERIYVCTNNGVQQLTPGQDGRYGEQVFHRRDGLLHDECNRGAQGIDGRDRYWVGTLGGLVLFDPGAQQPAAVRAARAVRFTALHVDGATTLLPGPAALDLAAGVRDVRVDYALLSGQRETESRYRSQLVGYDSAPTAWSAERTRAFTRLPPGTYELRVEAQDYAGTPSQAALTFSVAPLWYQHTWLQSLVAGILTLLLAGGAFSYVHRARTRQRWLQQEVAHRTAALHAVNERLTELSYSDPLTGVANRRRLMETLALAIDRARRRHLPIGIAILDVDHFKAYNDRHGHLAGDAALRAVAQIIKDATRVDDLVARFGGEEFACLMLDADARTVEAVVERMRVMVETLTPQALGKRETITLSAGVLCRVPHPHERPEDLLDAADAALYKAKDRGRNRTVLQTDSPL